MGSNAPGGVGRLSVRDGRLHLEVLDDAGRHLAATLELDDHQRHALHHLHAAIVAGGGHRPITDVVVAALAAADARATALHVVAGPPVRFALAVHGPWGSREVALDVVDAAALIFSQRVPLRVEAPAVDWDRELGQLLA